MKYKKQAQNKKTAPTSAAKTAQNAIKKEKGTSFFKFITKKPQILDFAIILGGCLLAYMGIKYCYPYPLTFSDSGGYVEAAMKDIFYVYRPFGYSYFLQILHAITTNIHSIFIVQTFLLFIATCFLALTVKYFYAPTKKWLWYMALSFLIFTPTSFVMANWILSDLLFSVQVYFIVSLFIFIIKRESWIATILYIILLFTALHVRYSAMVFPFALLPFFLMRKGKVRWLIILLSLLAFYVFYAQTKNAMKKTVKKEQFSTGFDGWTYANNVFYVLPHIDLKTKDLKSPKLKKFHNFIMDDIDIIADITNKNPSVSTGFLWSNKLQLKQYLSQTMQEQKTEYLPTFVELGSGIYKDYAMHIMTHYPFSYFQYYLLSNCKQTFYPPSGCIAASFFRNAKVIYDYYNIDEENTMQRRHDACRNPKYETGMQILHLIMWITIVAIGIVALLKRKKIIFSAHDKIVFWGLFSFAAIYYASSIFAAPMEIRYFISMHSVQFVCCYMLLNKLLGIKKDKNEIEATEEQPEKLTWKKVLFPFKYAPVVYLAIISLVVLFVFAFFRSPQNIKGREMQVAEIEDLRNTNDSKMSDYIEACEFFKSLPDTILVITRKPEIFNYYSDNKKAESFPYDANPDAIMSYLKEIKATHMILDDRYRYAYLTLYPAVQKYPEKFKVLKAIGISDTVAKRNTTYVLEFNDEWGYFGERIDGKKTGEGYELFQDGRKYVGEFSDNTPNGQGTLYSADGKIIVQGIWENGVLRTPN